jgi:hypothetical protein
MSEEHERFAHFYAELGRIFHLRTDLDPPAALRARAGEMESFMTVIEEPVFRNLFEGEIKLLRELADIVEVTEEEHGGSQDPG